MGFEYKTLSNPYNYQDPYPGKTRAAPPVLNHLELGPHDPNLDIFGTPKESDLCTSWGKLNIRPWASHLWTPLYNIQEGIN